MCERERERKGKQGSLKRQNGERDPFTTVTYVIGLTHLTLAIILKHTGMHLDILKIYNLEQ